VGEPRTDEIDLRPVWRRGLAARRGVPQVDLRAPVYMAAGALIAVVAMELGRSDSKEQAGPPPLAVKVSLEPAAEAPAPIAAPEEAAATVRAKQTRPAAEVPAPIAVPEKAAAPVRVKETNPAAPLTGKLVLESVPRVAVYAGARALGTTPCEIELEAGTHELRLVSKKSFIDVARKFRVQAGKVEKRALEFGLSTLRVDAPDGTKLSIDGRVIGNAPFEPIEIAEGTHHIVLVRDGEKLEERIHIPPSRTVDYRASL